MKPSFPSSPVQQIQFDLIFTTIERSKIKVHRHLATTLSQLNVGIARQSEVKAQLFNRATANKKLSVKSYDNSQLLPIHGEL